MSARGCQMLLALLAGAGLLTAAACTDDDSAGAGRLRVVASTPIVADWAAQVGGAHVAVTVLIPAGADVHTYQVSTGAVRSVRDADLVVLSGAGLEAGLTATVHASAAGPVVDLAETLPLVAFGEGAAHGEAAEAAEGARDPHYWLDPHLAAGAIARLRDALITVDPAHTDDYRANTSAYLAEVAAVDAAIEAVLSALPTERRLLVTFHDAYGYFARRYGLTVLGFVVEGPEEEPSAADLRDLVAAMRERGVTRIYREPVYDARVVEQVAAETHAEVRTLSSDLTAEAADYLSLLRAAARALAD